MKAIGGKRERVKQFRVAGYRNSGQRSNREHQKPRSVGVSGDNPGPAAQRKRTTGGNLENSPRPAALSGRQSGTAQMKPLAAGSGPGVIQMAGTKPRSFSTDGRFMIKLTSDREKYIYENKAGFGLADVMAGYHKVVDYTTHDEDVWIPGTGDAFHDPEYVTETTVTRVILDNGDVIPLKEAIDVPSSKQEIIAIDTIGYEAENAAPKEQKFTMDIKIGTYTKSGEQFQLEGAGGAMRFFKKLEHNLKDSKIWRSSRNNAYDICEGRSKFEAASRNAAIAVNFQIALAKIIGDVEQIRNAIAHSPATFVGSSVFCVFNLLNPANSVARFIDPDHPIIRDDAIGVSEPPADVMNKQHFDTQQSKNFFKRNWINYREKWINSFGSGINAVVAYFKRFQQ